MRKEKGFTLIELLVVIAIIALLMATQEGKQDVQWVQRGIWGKLGYKP